LGGSAESDEKNGGANKDKTTATTLCDMCLMEDFAIPAGPVLAHEFGHFLLSATDPPNT
jgi:hypothetical protein